MRNIYNNSFYKNRNEMTRYAAERILMILLNKFPVTSAVDFGCGVGTWLNTVREINAKKGIETCVLGLDGDYVNRDYLQIQQDEFVPTNLDEPVASVKGKNFDLAISLEVAEHLKPDCADMFVEELCAAGDIVLFSAATKCQGGDGHKNEQRASYWVELFNKHDYFLYDFIRKEVWNDREIPVWYRQNILVFLKKDRFSSLINVEEEILDIINPDLYEKKIRELNIYLKLPSVKFLRMMLKFGLNFSRKYLHRDIT